LAVHTGGAIRTQATDSPAAVRTALLTRTVGQAYAGAVIQEAVVIHRAFAAGPAATVRPTLLAVALGDALALPVNALHGELAFTAYGVTGVRTASFAVAIRYTPADPSGQAFFTLPALAALAAALVRAALLAVALRFAVALPIEAVVPGRATSATAPAAVGATQFSLA